MTGESDFEIPKPLKKKVRVGFGILLVLLLAADVFVPKRHPVLVGETLPGFYALFGILATLLIIFVAKALGRLITRKENYYDD